MKRYKKCKGHTDTLTHFVFMSTILAMYELGVFYILEFAQGQEDKNKKNDDPGLQNPCTDDGNGVIGGEKSRRRVDFVGFVDFCEGSATKGRERRRGWPRQQRVLCAAETGRRAETALFLV